MFIETFPLQTYCILIPENLENCEKGERRQNDAQDRTIEDLLIPVHFFFFLNSLLFLKIKAIHVPS